ncbi:RING finger protein [Patulibacter sp. NPDC049589]|uniref:RING finger protein n=1 Tax=Patulibacter sp. NPDC049589 TaxID=3154731 RepID=UPI00341DB8DE
MNATTGSAVGASCPYCHFPIKPGVEVTTCDACHAAHHVECWTENGGCAVTGCPQQAGVTADAPTQPLPQGAAAYAAAAAPTGAPAWASAPPPAPAGAGRRNGPHWGVIVALVALVLVLAVAAGYFALAPGDDDSGKQASATVAGTTSTAGSDPSTAPSSSPSGDAAAGTTDTGPTATDDSRAAEKQRVADELVEIMADSAEGRSANIRAGRTGNFGPALTKRTAVLRRLQGLHGADAAQESAIRTFEYAISESRKSVIRRRDDPSVRTVRTSNDEHATENKQLFCQKWKSSGMADLTGAACNPDAI